MRLKSAPRTEKRASKSLFELTPGNPWTERSGSSASTLARFLASLPPSTSVDGLSSPFEPAPPQRPRPRRGGAWLGGGRGSEGAGLHLHGVGAAKGLGTENDFKVLGLARVQVKRFLQQVVADGGNVQHV